MPEMSCLEFTLDATYEAIDWVRALLADTGYISDVNVSNYRSENESSTQWAFTLRFYIPYDSQANARVDTIERLLSSLHRTRQTSELDIAIVEEQPFQATELVHHIGKRFVVLPLQTTYQVQVDEIPLKLAESFAFGSGLHPATQLSLIMLERYIVPEMSVLDLGSGSGILSVAIAKLDAQVLALDNDAIAVEATKDAVERNDLLDRVTVMQGSLGQGSELGHWMSGETLSHVSAIEPTASFDAIVANILGRIHLSLIQEYRRALRPEGILIMAGFTADYEEELAISLTEAGFEKMDEERSNEWVALVYRLNPSQI
jgi:ribosomal protein L11 methyltransferase